jgi:hypothetical protein
MQSYIINKVTYTVRSKGLDESRGGGAQAKARCIPFTSMLTIEYIPCDHIKITLIDKSVVYITVDEDSANARDNANLFTLYSTLLL